MFYSYNFYQKLKSNDWCNWNNCFCRFFRSSCTLSKSCNYYYFETCNINILCPSKVNVLELNVYPEKWVLCSTQIREENNFWVLETKKKPVTLTTKGIIYTKRNKEVVLCLVFPLCFSLWINNSATLGKIKTFQLTLLLSAK